MAQEYIFRKHPIFAVIQNQTATVKKEVQSIPVNTLLNASEHDLIQTLVEKLRLSVPTVNETDIYIASSGETQVDVSGDPMRMFLDRSRPFYITGTETIIAVPFHGDADFFHVQPQTYSLSLPLVEIGLCLVSLGSTVASLETGHWFATPFASLFTFGYGYVAFFVHAEQVARRKGQPELARAASASLPPSQPATQTDAGNGDGNETVAEEIAA